MLWLRGSVESPHFAAMECAQGHLPDALLIVHRLRPSLKEKRREERVEDLLRNIRSRRRYSMVRVAASAALAAPPK
jgi:hypothetical protein